MIEWKETEINITNLFSYIHIFSLYILISLFALFIVCHISFDIIMECNNINQIVQTLYFPFVFTIFVFSFILCPLFLCCVL